MASTSTTASSLSDYAAPAPRRRLEPLIAFAKARPLGAACGSILVVVFIIAILADFAAPYSATENHPADAFLSPNGTYLLGTDNFGRDVLSRIIHGARISVQVAALSVIVSVAVSLTLGVSAAYLRGPWDYAVGRFVDVAQALPGIVLLILLLSVFGRSVPTIGIVLGLLSGIVGSRVVRGAAYSVAAQPFVEVARTVGCSPLRIMVRHVMPNVFPIVLVLASINVGTAIIAEASLSFIGYGVQPPTPSWGGMLSTEGRTFMVIAPWLFWAPTIALAVVVFCVNMFGDALRDRLDPRLRGGK
jgi:peptide/nickel transport system permease protein